MPKIVVLSEDTIIDGVARVAGEIVTVPDGYNELFVKRVVVTPEEHQRRRQNERARLAQLKEHTQTEANRPRIAVEPAEAVAGKTVTLTVRGRNTQFDDTSEVSLIPPDDVQVQRMNVESAVLLTVRVRIGRQARPGARGVRVVTGEQEVVARGALLIRKAVAESGPPTRPGGRR